MKTWQNSKLGILASVGVSAFGLIAHAHDGLTDSSVKTDTTPAWHETRATDVYDASNSQADLESDRILRLYQRGKMSAEVTDVQEHRSDGQTLFPHFSRMTKDSARSDRDQTVDTYSTTLRSTPLPTTTQSTASDIQTSPNSQITATTTTSSQVIEPAGTESSRSLVQTDSNGIAGGINNQDKDAQKSNHLSSKVSSIDASGQSTVVDSNIAATDPDASNLAGGINNQDKDAQKSNHKSSKASLSESSSQISEPAGADKSDIRTPYQTQDFDASNLPGGINNQDKDAQRSNHKSSKASLSDLGLSDEQPISTSSTGK